MGTSATEMSNHSEEKNNNQFHENLGPRLPEHFIIPERQGERPLEAAPHKETATGPEDTLPGRRSPPLPRRAAPAIPQVRDEVTLKIERLLEDGVGDAYARLSPIAREEFKLKGEETARTIRDLLKSTRLKVKKIFRLIMEWLQLLPGVNRFFLEQEAKIKTDRIIALHKQRKI